MHPAQIDSLATTAELAHPAYELSQNARKRALGLRVYHNAMPFLRALDAPTPDTRFRIHKICI